MQARARQFSTVSVHERYLLEDLAGVSARHKKRVERLLKESALPLERSPQNFIVKRSATKRGDQYIPERDPAAVRSGPTR